MVHQCLQLLLGVGRHCCIVYEQHVWWGLHEPLSWLWGDQDWKVCHLIWSADRFPLMLCQRRVSRAGQRRFQRALRLGRTLVWRRCGCQRAWRSCRWTALSLSCLCGKIRSCSAILVGSQSLGGSGRDGLCWRDQTPLWGQWKRYAGASVVLCTFPGVGEGRRLCLLLTFQLGSQTVFQDRHVLPASAVGSRWPLQRLCQWRWEGRCLCSCRSHSSLSCSWRVWWSSHPACLVVQLLLASTDRGVHAENAVRWSCSASVGLGGGGGGGVLLLPEALPEAKLSTALLSSSKVGSVSSSSMVSRHSTVSRVEGGTMFSLE